MNITVPTYDTLFAKGIPVASFICWSFIAFVGLINSILTPFFFYFGCYKQHFHRNLR